MKYGFFTERYGYGLFKETENNIIVEFVPSGDTLIEIMVIDKPKKRLDTSYVRKRVKRVIKINDLCDDRSRSRRDELIIVLTSSRYQKDFGSTNESTRSFKFFIVY